MTRAMLIGQILARRSYLCVGLDSDIKKIPEHLLQSDDPIFEFNRQIIDATRNYCVAYKINTAFYEALGIDGWRSMEKTVQYIPDTHLKIADAKRGDIGNTASQYAKAFFETFSFDAITVAPYMGSDSILPFLEYKNKWTIVLGLTSNSGAADFELQKFGDEYLYERVLSVVSKLGTPDNLMFVVGATQGSWFKRIREMVPDHFFLVPGIGAQGGSLEEVSKLAMNTDTGLLVNASRAIIFASNGKDFAARAEEAARVYQKEMEAYLK